MKVILEPWAFVPKRAHSHDAGLDLFSPVNIQVNSGDNCVIDTGVHVELPEGRAGVLISKSGLNVNHDITSTGLIDEQYQGSIRVKLYNHGQKGYVVHRGDKISQLVVIPVDYVDIEIVDSFDSVTERGSQGFGSSGR